MARGVAVDRSQPARRRPPRSATLDRNATLALTDASVRIPLRTAPVTDFAPILPVAGIRAVEARCGTAGLMERAGAAAAEVARKMAAGHAGPIVVLAGPGNNGGDAFVVARLLSQAFFDVVTVYRGDPLRLPPDAAAAHAALSAAGLRAQTEPPVGKPALVVDGLFGIGLTRAPAPEHAALIAWAASAGAPILALDVPSGVDADTGAAFDAAVRANATATFIAQKPGLCTGAGLDRAGAVSLHTLGVAIDASDGAGCLLEWAAVECALPEGLRRTRRDVHKGTFGTVAIVGGTEGMAGAPILAGRAALKTGAGKVLIGFTASTRPAVDWAAPELMLRTADAALASGADVLVVGPGLGLGRDARRFVEQAARLSVPLVLDADALNLVARDATLRALVQGRAATTLITPHPAEAARLLGVDNARIAADRLGAARALAQDLRASCVLKGAGSVLAYPDGGFDINASGGPALATAGSGDVLAGILGALLAQGLSARVALRIGVCLHGAAADRLVASGTGPVGLVASELADAARALINTAQGG